MKISVEDVLFARHVYSQGGNVTQALRERFGEKNNTAEIIELAYDLQAGSYIDWCKKNEALKDAFVTEVGAVLDDYLSDGDTVLDVGSGELTTLSHLIKKLRTKMGDVHACDISWSRIYKGRLYAEKIIPDHMPHLHLFMADMFALPLPTGSVDVVITSHSLEPNGGKEPELLRELFRICTKRLFLFEPDFLRCCDAGKKRMKEMGYITNLPNAVADQGGKLIARIPLEAISNPLNPTSCFIIEPPQLETSAPLAVGQHCYTVPGSDFSLHREDDFLLSRDSGLCFPVIKEIPALRTACGILATSLCH